MTIIKAQHYEDCVIELVKTEAVQNMAKEIMNLDLTKFIHEDGSARCDFMLMANKEFSKRNTEELKNPQHIGAVAEALLFLLRPKLLANKLCSKRKEK